ncbi:MAG: 50S ribosomal protein L9 [Nitrospira sp.]|nr:MAG: 50S ribosomal protein L9 [Nitrospira sp.]
MKVILQQTMEGVGHLGDILDVSDGYARNFLLPRGKAMVASDKNVKSLEHLKRVTGEKAKKEKLEVESYAKTLTTAPVTIVVQVGKENKLFGSVTSKDLEEALAAQGHTVDRRKIQLGQPIKELGTFTVPVKLHRDITASLSVHVVARQEPAAAAGEAKA